MDTARGQTKAFVVKTRPEIPDAAPSARHEEVGDFYGDMNDAAIDPDERWCVMVGCGIIVYRLGPPWKEYSCPSPVPLPNGDLYQVIAVDPSRQWWEGGREPPVLWITEVEHLEGERFEARVAGWAHPDHEDPSRLLILADWGVVRPLDWLPDIQ
jgi:hypothetical protein